jgi:hypothetical protein
MCLSSNFPPGTCPPCRSLVRKAERRGDGIVLRFSPGTADRLATSLALVMIDPGLAPMPFGGRVNEIVRRPAPGQIQIGPFTGTASFRGSRQEIVAGTFGLTFPTVPGTSSQLARLL